MISCTRSSSGVTELAEQRVAILRSNTVLGPQTRLLSFVLPTDVEYPHVAGKYIIVDTGLLLADGRVRKRAYTLVSYDAGTKVFEIAVRHVGEATEYLQSLMPGAELRFSGPWGKYFPYERDADENIWIVATDTGITAALGLLQVAELEGRLGGVKLFWWLIADNYFLPKEFVENRLPDLKSFQIVDVPGIGDVQRVAAGQRWISEALEAERPSRIYLSGDGNIVLPWIDILNAEGVPSDRIHIETFFNHTKSKA